MSYVKYTGANYEFVHIFEWTLQVYNEEQLD